MPSQIKNLTAMLFRKGVSKTDASALRYALHVLENSVYRPKAIYHKDFPYWRMVQYTDDGCCEYQCLNCKGGWEGRGAPGWVDFHEEVDEVDSTGSYKLGDKMVFYRERKRPRYKADWKYCPHCNIEWYGPIRKDQNNERMLGARRRCIQFKVNKHNDAKRYVKTEPAFYWVLEYCEPQTRWIKEKKFEPVNAKKIRATLTRIRNHYHTKPLYYDPDAPRKRRYRITKMKNTDANQRKLNTLSDGYT